MTTPTQAQIEAVRETPSREIQLRCHGAVRRAIKLGYLVRPKQCERCGDRPRPNKSGVSQIHAHHKDHSKPLLVEWLCVACHRIETPWPSKPSGRAFGVVNGAARLNPGRIRTIRRRFKNGESGRKIAFAIGVNPTTVQRVISGKYWSHVE